MWRCLLIACGWRAGGSACAQHPVEAQGYAAAFISKFVPDFVDATPPTGVASVPHDPVSLAVMAAPSNAFQELVSPTASPVTSPTTSPAAVVASEQAAAAASAEHRQKNEQQGKKKRTNSAASFLALSQRNQKKIFVGSASSSSAGPPAAKEMSAGSDDPHTAKGIATKKPAPTLASFFSKK